MFRPLLEHIVAAGHDPATVLPRFGLDLRHLTAAGAALSPLELTALSLAAPQLTGRSDIAFELGRSINPLEAFGALAVAAIGCGTVEELFQFLCRRFDLISDAMSAAYVRDGEFGVVRVVPASAIGRDAARFVLEYFASAVPSLLRLIGGAPPELAADFFLDMPRPAHAARYAEPPYDRYSFESQLPGLTIVLPNALRSWRLPMAEPRAVATFEAGLAQRAEAVGLAGQVRIALRGASGKPPSIEDLALRLGISARTLDRGLAREGCSFRELAREVLVERARALLAVPGASVTQVAQQLGFSDAANFTRSFRKATGVTPGDLRDADDASGRSLAVD